MFRFVEGRVVQTLPSQCMRRLIQLIVVACVFVAWSARAAELPTGYELVAENDSLILYIDRNTAETAIQVKASGEIWYSNPPDRKINERIAKGAMKDRLNSQASIEYLYGNSKRYMDTYTDSVKNGQYSISPIEGGVRVDYRLGVKWSDEDYVPILIEQSRFDDLILSKIESERDRKTLRGLYTLFDLTADPSLEEIDVFGLDSDRVFRDLRLNVMEAKAYKTRDKQRLLQDILVRIKDYKGYATLGEVKHEDLVSFVDTPTYVLKTDIMAWDRTTISKLVKAVGYSPEEIGSDHRQYNIAPPYPNIALFTLSIEYRLDGDNLVVRVPGDSISYPFKVDDPENNRVTTLPMVSINLLRYFGATVDSDGYIFVPDGCGAIISLGTKANTVPYDKPVYGRDFALAPLDERLSATERELNLPVFGLKQGDKAIFAVIEDGDAMASIEAETAGMRDSYNKVSANFAVIPFDSVHLESTGAVIGLRDLSISMYQSRAYQGDIVIRYSFLDGQDADYVGMAATYQRYLVEKRGLRRLHPDDDGIPFFLNLIAGIDTKRPVMGFPRKVVEPLTTYDQASEIVARLLDAGVSNIKLRMDGWLKGGVRHDFPTRVKLEPAIGGSADLEQLNSYLEAHDVEFFPNVSLLNAYPNGLLSGFWPAGDASHFINREVAYVAEFDLATYWNNSITRYVVSPRRLDTLVSGFLHEYVDYGIKGLSLSFMGQQLNSDFLIDPEETVDRQQARRIIEAQLQKMGAAGLDLLVRGGNAYVLPYVKYVVDLPGVSGSAPMLDRPVPFAQIVLHGFVGYAGEPINMAADPEVTMLKLLETGGYPYYTWCYADASVLKNTDFHDLYSITYKGLEQSAIDYYRRANELLKGVQDQRIIDHEALAEDVYRTTYENGLQVIVNYRREPVEVAGAVVPARGYITVIGRR